MNWYPCWSYRIQDYQSLPAKVKNLTQKVCIHNNINGNAIRILLSNQYGQDTLYFDHLCIEFNHHVYPLTVCGKESIALKSGEEIYTDEVEVLIPAKTDILIQIYFPKNKITGYVGLNSQSMINIEHYGDINSDVLNRKFNEFVYFGIRSVEVKTNIEPYMISVFGDSLVHQGYWMNQLFYHLYLDRDNVVVVNEGISGNRLLRDATSSSKLNSIFKEAGIKRFEKDVFERYKPNLVLFAEGINDLVHPGNGCSLEELPHFEEMKEGYLKIQEIVHQYQSQIIFATLSPFCNYDGIWNRQRETIRQQINAWIRTHQQVLDIDYYLRDENIPEQLMHCYDGGDHLHFNQYASQVITQNILDMITHIIKREG